MSLFLAEEEKIFNYCLDLIQYILIPLFLLLSIYYFMLGKIIMSSSLGMIYYITSLVFVYILVEKVN